MKPLGFLRSNAPFLTAGAILTFCSSFGQTFFISVFAGEIRAEFGLSHGLWGSIYSLGTMGSAIVMIWAGLLTDHLRVRILGPIVLVGLALACLLMSAVPAVWMLPIAIFALRLCGQGMCMQVGIVAVSRWFNANRGKAISVVILGVALGEALLPLIFASLLPFVGWRTLWGVAAIAVLAFIPILWPLLRLERTPQSIAADRQIAGMNGLHWTRGQIIRNPLFWFVLPLVFGPAAFSTAFFFLQVHTAEIKGWSHVMIVALFPVFTLSSVASMLVFGWLIDRLGTARLMPFFILPAALGFLVFWQAESLILAALGMSLMGISQGGNSTVPNAFWAEFYGTRHLGAIRALATSAMVLATGLGPAISGLGIDAGMTFPQQMPFIAAYYVAASVFVWIGLQRAKSALPDTA